MIECEHDHLMLVFKRLIVENNLLPSCTNRTQVVYNGQVAEISIHYKYLYLLNRYMYLHVIFSKNLCFYNH